MGLPSWCATSKTCVTTSRLTESRQTRIAWPGRSGLGHCGRSFDRHSPGAAFSRSMSRSDRGSGEVRRTTDFALDRGAAEAALSCWKGGNDDEKSPNEPQCTPLAPLRQIPDLT